MEMCGRVYGCSFPSIPRVICSRTYHFNHRCPNQSTKPTVSAIDASPFSQRHSSKPEKQMKGNKDHEGLFPPV